MSCLGYGNAERIPFDEDSLEIGIRNIRRKTKEKCSSKVIKIVSVEELRQGENIGRYGYTKYAPPNTEVINLNVCKIFYVIET